MAATFTAIEVLHTGSERLWCGTFTPDTSYPTGGYPVTAATLQIDGVNVVSCVPAGVGISGANGASRLCGYDPSTGKIKVFTAIGTEAANGSDQSAATFLVIASVK